MSEDVNSILIEDILQSCPEDAEHEFSPKYLRSRQRMIKHYSKFTATQKRHVRTPLKIAAVIAAALLLFTGWNGYRFINGLAVGSRHIFAQMTPDASEAAHDSIESTAKISGLNGYTYTITLDRPDQFWIEYTNGEVTYMVHQYTLSYYNSLQAHISFLNFNFKPFSAGDKSGVCSVTPGGLNSAVFIYKGYVFDIWCTASMEELTAFAEAMTI